VHDTWPTKVLFAQLHCIAHCWVHHSALHAGGKSCAVSCGRLCAVSMVSSVMFVPRPTVYLGGDYALELTQFSADQLSRFC
jgi:hypothetical protein